MGKLTVVIPSRNDENLARCLVAFAERDPLVSVVVVDDGLDNRPNWTPQLRFIHGSKPFIFARNSNIGIRYASQYTGPESDVILLNDDALLQSPGGFTAMQREAEQNPEFGLISAAVRGPSNAQEHKQQRPDGLRELAGFTVPFICVLIPRRTIELVGLLDERFDCYGGDDDDYCYRVRKAGLNIGICDGCVVDHGSLQSTFRPDGRGLPIDMARRIFRKIHGFEMATQ